MNEHPLIKILNKHPEYTRLVDALKKQIIKAHENAKARQVLEASRQPVLGRESGTTTPGSAAEHKQQEQPAAETGGVQNSILPEERPPWMTIELARLMKLPGIIDSR